MPRASTAAWRSLIAGEMIYGSLGLGFLLMMGRDLNDMSQVLAVMGLIMFLGYVVDRVFFVNVERHIRARWGFAPTSQLLTSCGGLQVGFLVMDYFPLERFIPSL